MIDQRDEAAKAAGTAARLLESPPNGLPRRPAKRQTSRKALAICLGLLAGCYASGFVVCVFYVDPPIHWDFFAMWSWALFLNDHPAARLYDHAAQQAFLWSLDPGLPKFPFPYPPTYMMVIRPLGWFSYPVAQTLWSGSTLLAYAAAFWSRRDRTKTMALALLAPATAINLLYGQNGFLCAALLVAGMRLAPSRPLLGGGLLGLLCFKPHLGILIPVALAAARFWRSAVAAALVAGIFAAVSIAAFGLDPWVAWIDAMPDLGRIAYEQRARSLHLMPTALPNALAFGAGENLALAIQAAVSVIAGIGVWLAFRRDQGRTAIAALCVGTILASPYAYPYDLTLVGAAIALFVGQQDRGLSPVEVLILAIGMAVPAGIVLNILPPIGTLVHLAVFGVVLSRLRRASPIPCEA